MSAPELLPEGGLPLSILGSGDRTAIMEWLAKAGDYEKNHMDETIAAAVQDLRNDGCTTFAIYGQCWGALISAKAAWQAGNVFLACGGPHPSIKSIDWVKDIKCPMILCLASDDDDMVTWGEENTRERELDNGWMQSGKPGFQEKERKGVFNQGIFFWLFVISESRCH